MRRHKTVANDLRSAQEALGNSEYQKAEDILVTYIVKHTKDTDAYMLLGQVALGRGDWEGAIEIFEQVVNWSAKQEGAYAALGHAAYKAGHFKQSLVALQRAREAEPGNSAVLQELLDIAQKMDNRALQHSLQEDLEQVQKNSEEENSHAAV
jgi:tetratricopeptide (TPR) repeat protein